MQTANATDAQISGWADKIMAEIHKDMRTGFPWGKRIPECVGAFYRLHDYCDANMYVINVLTGVFPRTEEDNPEDDVMFCDAETDAANRIMDEVDKRLKAEAFPIHVAGPCGIDHS